MVIAGFPELCCLEVLQWMAEVSKELLYLEVTLFSVYGCNWRCHVFGDEREWSSNEAHLLEALST